MLFQELLRWI